MCSTHLCQFQINARFQTDGLVTIEEFFSKVYLKHLQKLDLAREREKSNIVDETRWLRRLFFWVNGIDGTQNEEQERSWRNRKIHLASCWKYTSRCVDMSMQWIRFRLLSRRVLHCHVDGNRFYRNNMRELSQCNRQWRQASCRRNWGMYRAFLASVA